MSAREGSAAKCCDLPVDEFLAGPGGWTERQFEGKQYVSAEQFEEFHEFLMCALRRLEDVLIEADRRGIDRSVMEGVMRHGVA